MRRRTETLSLSGPLRRQFIAPGWLLLALWVLVRPALAGAYDEDEARADRGRELLTRYHCGSCHTIPGVSGAQGKLAVSLQAYGRRSYIAGRIANEPDGLVRWITDPSSVVPGTLMPDLGVAPDDARAMALYLGRLQ